MRWRSRTRASALLLADNPQRDQGTTGFSEPGEVGPECQGQRRLAAERKRAHGELANRVLAQGKTSKTERLSFQRCSGRSGKGRGAGTVIAEIKPWLRLL
ncbi:MAG TPA: hypothetical protein VMK12_15720 [Anaeromyxobacteraceae bacterium]|nr:hypothetical protein [Anaeromyxobacteraceae bacterium]